MVTREQALTPAIQAAYLGFSRKGQVLFRRSVEASLIMLMPTFQDLFAP
jgi:hypothetical protein